MILYLTARLFAWLYGFDWPLGKAPNGDNINAMLAMLSILSFPFEVFCAVMIVKDFIGGMKRKAKVGND